MPAFMPVAQTDVPLRAVLDEAPYCPLDLPSGLEIVCAVKVGESKTRGKPQVQQLTLHILVYSYIHVLTIHTLFAGMGQTRDELRHGKMDIMTGYLKPDLNIRRKDVAGGVP
jgi:hypothetical protein